MLMNLKKLIRVNKIQLVTNRASEFDYNTKIILKVASVMKPGLDTNMLSQNSSRILE